MAKGQRLLSSAGCDVIFDEQVRGTDLVFGVPVRLGMGFALNVDRAMGPNDRLCYWGGSAILIDFDAHLTMAYVMNKMNSTTVGDIRSASLVQATYESLAAAA